MATLGRKSDGLSRYELNPACDQLPAALGCPAKAPNSRQLFRGVAVCHSPGQRSIGGMDCRTQKPAGDAVRITICAMLLQGAFLIDRRSSSECQRRETRIAIAPGERLV